MEESVLCQWGVIRSMLAILQWWSFNVAVIITNKWIFQKLDFKFPLTVSCIHFISSAIGAYLVIKVLKLKPLILVEPEDANYQIFHSCNDSCLAVADLEQVFRMANLGFFDSHCHISHICN